MSECTPTEADREDAKSFLIGLSLDGTDETPQSFPAEGVDDIVAELAALFAKVRADERAKRPDREALERIAAECEADIPYDDGNETAKLIGKRIREALALPDERAKRPDREQIERALFEADGRRNYDGSPTPWHILDLDEQAHYRKLADAALSSLALKTETDQELQDRIEVLEKNLTYEVAQKIKLADTLRDERAKRPDREQIERTVRAHRVWWNFETGSLCQCGWKCLLSEHPAHVADAVLALEPEAREESKHGLIEDYTAVQAPDWTKVSGKLDAREVTDAEVEAAWASLSRSSHRWPDISDMRAALEAAREVE